MKAATISPATLDYLREYCESEELSLNDPFLMRAPMPCACCSKLVDAGYLLPGVGFACAACVIKSYILGLVESIDAAAIEKNRLGMLARFDAEDKARPFWSRPEWNPEPVAEGPQLNNLVVDDADRGYGPEGPKPYTGGLVQVAADDRGLPAGSICYYVRDEHGQMVMTTEPPVHPRPLSTAHIDRIVAEDPECAPQPGDPYVGPAIVRKAAYHEHVTPDVAPEHGLPAEDHALFEGANPGRVIIASARDVARYELTYGDPELMAILEEEDDQWAAEQGYEVGNTGVRTRGHTASVRTSRKRPT
jgi:hypothetical protein